MDWRGGKWIGIPLGKYSRRRERRPALNSFDSPLPQSPFTFFPQGITLRGAYAYADATLAADGTPEMLGLRPSEEDEQNARKDGADVPALVPVNQHPDNSAVAAITDVDQVTGFINQQEITAPLSSSSGLSSVDDQETSTSSSIPLESLLPSVTPSLSASPTPTATPLSSSKDTSKFSNAKQASSKDDVEIVDEVAVSRHSVFGVVASILFILMGIAFSAVYLWRKREERTLWTRPKEDPFEMGHFELGEEEEGEGEEEEEEDETMMKGGGRSQGRGPSAEDRNGEEGERLVDQSGA